MIVGLMQPYFFPYIGYMQLINAVDTFVIYDDVNYIKQGWINRNRILLNQKDFMISLQLKGSSSFSKINEIEIGQNADKLLKTITQAYAKAPYYKTVFPLLNDILLHQETNLAKYLEHQFRKLSEYLGIQTNIIISSDLAKDNALKGQDKVLAICKTLGATTYINSIGGQALYSKEVFGNHGIKLYFLQSKEVNYKQFSEDFIPWLSVIDVLMFNDKEAVRDFLNQYSLV